MFNRLIAFNSIKRLTRHPELVEGSKRLLIKLALSRKSRLVRIPIFIINIFLNPIFYRG